MVTDKKGGWKKSREGMHPYRKQYLQMGSSIGHKSGSTGRVVKTQRQAFMPQVLVW